MAPELLTAVYSEDLRRGTVVAYVSLVPCKLFSFTRHASLRFSLLWWPATRHQMKLKLLTKKKKKMKLHYNGSWWASSRKKHNQKKKSILLLWSQHTAQNTWKTAALPSLNSYLFSLLKGITEKLRRQLERHFLWKPKSILGASSGRREKYLKITEQAKKGRRKYNDKQ